MAWTCPKCKSKNIKGTTIMKCKLNIQIPKRDFLIGYKCDSLELIEGDGVDTWECLDCGEKRKRVDLREWGIWEKEGDDDNGNV